MLIAQDKALACYGKASMIKDRIDRLLDIGCGWGSIILESASLYNIRSVGITLSKNQYEIVKDKIEELG